MLIRMHACKVGDLKEVYKELGWTDQNMKCLMKTFLVSSGGSCFLWLGPHPGDTLKIAPYWALWSSHCYWLTKLVRPSVGLLRRGPTVHKHVMLLNCCIFFYPLCRSANGAENQILMSQVIVTWQPALLMWIWHHGKDIMQVCCPFPWMTCCLIMNRFCILEKSVFPRNGLKSDKWSQLNLNMASYCTGFSGTPESLNAWQREC